MLSRWKHKPIIPNSPSYCSAICDVCRWLARQANPLCKFCFFFSRSHISAPNSCRKILCQLVTLRIHASPPPVLFTIEHSALITMHRIRILLLSTYQRSESSSRVAPLRQLKSIDDALNSHHLLWFEPLKEKFEGKKIWTEGEFCYLRIFSAQNNIRFLFSFLDFFLIILQ